MVPNDAKIIENIPLNQHNIIDRDGWHFIKNKKYTVKSGYQVEKIYPYIEKSLPINGLDVTVLKVFCWKIKCHPKLSIFMVNNIMMYLSKGQSSGERNSREYTMFTMWRRSGINKSCVL